MAENEIVNQNADAQENTAAAEQATEVSTATTNAPVEETATAEVPAEETAPAEAVAVEEPKAAAKPERAPETPHDDFDWSIDKRNVSTYNKEEREKYDGVYDNTFVQINDGEIINGTVV